MSAGASATERPRCGSERAVPGSVVGHSLDAVTLVEARVRVPREAAAGSAVREDHREAVLGAARDVGQRAAVGGGQRAFAHGPDHRFARRTWAAVTSAGLVQPSSFRPSSSSRRSSSSTSVDALLAAGREAVEHGAAGERRPRAERERLEHVGATADAAVDQHLDPLADRLDHLGQDVQRRRHAVELAPAVVRDDDRGGTVLGSQQRVLVRSGSP